MSICKFVLRFSIILIVSFTFFSCNSSDSSDSDKPVLTEEEFINSAVSNFKGYTYNFTNPGEPNGDKIFVNDAVIIIETLKKAGYDIPKTGEDGLYDNYYSDLGYYLSYKYPSDPQTDIGKQSFIYTINSSVTDDDITNKNWDSLKPGDILFVDYDLNNLKDIAAIYLGQYESYSHAVFYASDLHKTALVEDLDDPNSAISLDIKTGVTKVKTLDLKGISQFYINK